MGYAVYSSEGHGRPLGMGRYSWAEAARSLGAALRSCVAASYLQVSENHQLGLFGLLG